MKTKFTALVIMVFSLMTLNSVFAEASSDTVPDIRGVYSGSYIIVVSNCTDTFCDGTYEASLIINISNQTGDTFSGLAVGTFVQDGLIATENITLTGTITTTGEISGNTSHTFLGTAGEGTFTGQLSGNTLSIQNSGHDTVGETCDYTRSMWATREGGGDFVTSDLWIRAVINTVEKGPIEAVWQKGGEDTTSRGDTVIWGHFYASPSDVIWGSENNPDLFIKIWFDASGRVDVNFFHVSVPDIDVYSDYPKDGAYNEFGTTTMDRRYIRHEYYPEGGSAYFENYENGLPAGGYSQTGDPSGYSTINDLRIGSIINTVEKGPIDAVWSFGGQDTTSRGDEVVWGHFYASPSDVTWGSQDNPDLFVKIWFDVSGRVGVNFFHVSVPDIEVYSDLPDDGTYDQKGTTIMDNRYIRQEYWR